MKMYIARDEETEFCRLFTSKPEKKYNYYHEKVMWTNGKRNDGVQLDMGDFPEVTFENSPQEVELVIKKKEQA